MGRHNFVIADIVGIFFIAFFLVLSAYGGMRFIDWRAKKQISNFVLDNCRK